MFKEFFSGVTKFFTSDKVLILVVFLVLVIGLSMYSGSKKSKYDAMTNKNSSSSYDAYDYNSTNAWSPASVDGDDMLNGGDAVSEAYENMEEEFDYGNENFEEGFSSHNDSSSYGGDSSGLLPNDQNSQWASLNPVSGGNIAAPDLLQAGYNIGLDTIGQTLRNANYQLRSDPIIPKQNVGPWMQSTIEPDLGRVPLEIGFS